MLELLNEQAACSVECDLTGSIMIKDLVKRRHSCELIKDKIILWSASEADGEEVDGSGVQSIPPESEREDSEMERPEIETNGAAPAADLRGGRLNPRASRSSSLSTPSNSSLAPASSNATSAAQQPPVKTLVRGQHLFFFAFDLPAKGLYNSLEFERGSISYVITATFRMSGIEKLTSKKKISVICPIDVSLLAIPKPSMLAIEVRKKKRETGIIQAKIDIPARGYLKGDTVQVTITINHVRPVKSVHGVIVTLSRISRVRGGELELQSFRKDLAQTVSALLIHSDTNLSQVISTKLKIPLEVFPTTKGHDMVSFQYCIEAVIDLAGKWNLNISDDESASRLGFIDTDKLKKNRGVVSLWMEVVIGTDRGSGLPPKRARAPSQPQDPRRVAEMDPTNRTAASPSSPVNSTNGHAPQVPSTSSPSYTQYSPSAPSHSPAYAESEKERLRMMEAALLPSEPGSNHPSIQPSAPSLDNIHAPVHADSTSTQPAPATVTTPEPSTSSHTDDKLERERRYLETQASSPGPSASSPSHHHPHVPVAPPASASTSAPPHVRRNGGTEHPPEDYEYDVPAYEEPASGSGADGTAGNAPSDAKIAHLLPSEPQLEGYASSPAAPSAPSAPPSARLPNEEQEAISTAPSAPPEPSAPLAPSSLIQEEEATAPPMPSDFSSEPSAPPAAIVRGMRDLRVAPSVLPSMGYHGRGGEEDEEEEPSAPPEPEHANGHVKTATTVTTNSNTYTTTTNNNNTNTSTTHPTPNTNNTSTTMNKNSNLTTSSDKKNDGKEEEEEEEDDDDDDDDGLYDKPDGITTGN